MNYVYEDQVTANFPNEETALRFRRGGRTDLSIRIVSETQINVFSQYKNWAPAFKFDSIDAFKEWAAPK
jgi:hypothetical protein